MLLLLFVPIQFSNLTNLVPLTIGPQQNIFLFWKIPLEPFRRQPHTAPTRSKIDRERERERERDEKKERKKERKKGKRT